MAALYGRLQGERGEATRTGHRSISAKVETWEGSVRVTMDKDGEFVVFMGDKFSPSTVIARGNANTKEVHPL